ncbi:DUF4255 domain-containing protein [Hansschlegelia zhihuaiae]|uniref:DUF4255 domain-containing protein n=1 Tax=Hansschlegelia zhihuaiae TaxID=405005 RepID=A0A4Q0MK64_9HYPH|nr:DUF4255 domain-containing protein [Hansschlegelia zhihuaiae]RXF74131.1 DUF4255 domain-containing protein [Hansschlegelia zhihuaiae]
MADHTAIAAVSRTLRALLLDRMSAPAAVTLAPPDVDVDGVEGARVNLYLYQVLENPYLANQEAGAAAKASGYGAPPLSLDLRYLMTTHSAQETSVQADLNAQTLLGDAMRVMHFFGPQIHALSVTRPAAGTVGDPLLDPSLASEYERIRPKLHPANLDDTSKIWSAMAEENFRRTVIYEVKVVQIEPPEPRRRPVPVGVRRIMATPARRPVIVRAYVTPAPGEPTGETRARIGDEITIETALANAPLVYVRLGALDPIRLPPSADGFYRVVLPDDFYDHDLDHPTGPLNPILAPQQLQPGLLEVRVVVRREVDGVEGGELDRGDAFEEARDFSSNVALLQLVPEITGVTPGAASGGVLRVTGARLWRSGAREAVVTIGDAAVRIRPPVGADPWLAPTATQVEVPIAEAAARLADPPAGGDVYPVAVEVDGARSRDAFAFRLDP